MILGITIVLVSLGYVNTVAIVDISNTLPHVTSPWKCYSDSYSCSNHGFCVNNETACQCDDYFLTTDISSDQHCNYEQRRITIAFLLALLFGYIGAGRFYLSYYIQGLLKVTLLSCSFVYVKRGYNFWNVLVTILWLIDSFMILNYTLYDGNNMLVK